MNTRRTIRNWSDAPTEDSDDERDREHDDYEKQRARDDDHYRAGSGTRHRTRTPASRRVTGAESLRPPSVAKKRGIGETHGATVGASPSKRHQPVPIRLHLAPGGEAPASPARYRGTEAYDTRREGHPPTSDRLRHVKTVARDTRATHERRRVFDNEAIKQHEFIEHFMDAAEATPQPELDGIIAEMDKEQLVASLQHMALQWKTLQGDASSPAPSGRHQADRRTSQPTVDVLPGDVTTLTPRAR